MNTKSRLAACIALVLSASAGSAGPLYSFDTTPSKLPKSVLPRHYALALAPDLQALTTLGQETVDIEVREPVARIVLNAVDIAIDEAGIDDNARSRDDALARQTLALTLTREVPGTIVGGLINEVAVSGWQPQLAWDFIRQNLDALTALRGPDFRDQFIPNFMTNFHDEAHAAELAQFAPAQATTGGRVMTARALEGIAISIDVERHTLPLVDRWIAEHPARQ